jgi:tetratricopeptide (TPR) repeat protein
MASDLTERLQEAKEYAEAGQYAKAWPVVSDALHDEPDEPRALSLAVFMLERQGNSGLAYQTAKRLTALYPTNAIGWLNLGKCCDTLWRMDEAEAAYQRAANTVKPTDEVTKVTIHTNRAALALQLGKFQDAANHSARALQIDPKHLKSRHNMGISLLAMQRWAEGWPMYAASVGSAARPAYQYGNEPVWQGERGTLAVYGEQGIGDEICAASMFEDAAERAGRLIIDCDKRLATLFRRSFPFASVYGTRTEKVLNWAESDQQIDYSIASMQLGGVLRTEPAAFPAKPYLTADPDDVLMWRALWAAKGKPAVGIAWTGGIRSTGSHMRSIDPAMLAPILGIDAHFVDLEYRADSARIPGVTRYEQATFAKDYDRTAGLVASLDAVVSVPTSVAHLAGALGVPLVAMKAPHSCWKYNAGLPFHPAHLIDNAGDWAATIAAAAAKLKEMLHGRPA